MKISYEEIFANFLGNVTDYEFASLEKEDAYLQMTEWLHKALAKTYIRRLFSTLTFDDDVLVLDYTLAKVVDEDADKDFVTDVIAKGMIVEWLRPKVASTLSINQMFAGKEQKMFSQASHLNEIKDLYENTRLEMRKMIRDRGFVYNDYVEGS